MTDMGDDVADAVCVITIAGNNCSSRGSAALTKT